MNEEQLKAALEAASKDVTAAIEKANAENKTALEQIKKDIETVKAADKSEDITKEVIRIAGELKALKEVGNHGEAPAGLRGQIKSWIEANKSALASIKGGQKADLTPLVVKLNSPMLPANTYNGSAYLPQPQFEAGAVEIVRVQPTFWDYLKKGRTTAASYVWVNKKNPEGAAAFIGPGVIKPGISFGKICVTYFGI